MPGTLKSAKRGKRDPCLRDALLPPMHAGELSAHSNARSFWKLLRVRTPAATWNGNAVFHRPIFRLGELGNGN